MPCPPSACASARIRRCRGGLDVARRAASAHGGRPEPDGCEAFFYNAIFFTYALILTDFYRIAADRVGWYILPFAAGNFLRPVVLGRLFDTLGRRPMLAFTYAVSGLLLAMTGYLFSENLLSASQLTMAWMVIFFFASAAASAAYLTVSETFPLEIRAPRDRALLCHRHRRRRNCRTWLFGILIETGSRTRRVRRIPAGAALMIAAAIVAGLWAVAAERKSLEAVSRPVGLGRLKLAGMSLQQMAAIVHTGDAA